MAARIRFPRLERESCAGEKIARAAGRDISGEYVRRAPVGEPLVPEAILGAIADVRLDLRLLSLLLAFGLRLFGCQLRPDPADEGDALAVRKPAQTCRPVRHRSEPSRFPAVGRDEIDLRFLVILALRREGDPFAVGRPGGFAVLVARGQALRAAAICGKEPQLGPALVLFHVVGGDRCTCESAIR